MNSGDDFNDALKVALGRLRLSDRYEAEIRTALKRFDPAVVDRVILKLQELRMIDDARTTTAIVERNRGRRAVSAERLATKLTARGASEESVEEAIADATARDADLGDGGLACELLAAKYAELSVRNRARAGRFLHSRGFGEDTIEAALDTHFGELTEPTVDAPLDKNVFTE